MNETKVALDFWGKRTQYPNYPNTKQRRLLDVNFVVANGGNPSTILDLGCADGYLLIALREFTTASKFYGYDISKDLLRKLRLRWGNIKELETRVYDFTKDKDYPQTDLVLSMGSFSYIFKDEELHTLLRNVKSDLLIVRASCTLNKEDEIINKFSEDLGENYAAIYRTVSNYKSILSKHFIVSEISRAYPDKIESKYGTKHFFFVCKNGLKCF